MKRIALAFLATLTIVGSGPARAEDPDPFNVLQDALLSVTDVVATGIGPKSIFVSWKTQSLVATAFRIEIARDEAGPYTKAQIYPGGCKSCMTTIQLPQAPADPQPYFIRVVGVITVGGQPIPNGPEFGTTTILEGRPSAPDPAVLGPHAPTNVRCNGGGELSCVNVTNVTLTWTDNSDERNFWIMRARGAVNPNFGTQFHAELPANTTSFSETLADFSSVFQYRVTAVRKTMILRTNPVDGVQEPVEEFSFSNATNDAGKDSTNVVETAPLPPPSDPSGLVATFIAPNEAKLSWVDKELNPAKTYIEEDGWFIEQTTADADWSSKKASMHTRPTNVGQGVVTWSDTTLPPDTARCYRVRGYRFGPAFSDYAPRSNERQVCLGSTPKAPTNLTAVALSNAKVALAWIDNSNSETGFSVERCDGTCTDAFAWTEIAASVPMNAQSFLDETTVGNTTYSYRVRAVNFSGVSAPSNIATVRTPAPPLPAPLGLAAEGKSHAIQLTWNDIAGETGYRIEFLQFGQWATLAEVGVNVTMYLDQDSLGTNQTRCYRVRAFRGGSEVSDPSNVACATTLGSLPPDGAPSNVSTEVVQRAAGDGYVSSKILLSWTDNATNESHFEIQYAAFPHLACPQTPVVDKIPFVPLATAPAMSQPGGTVNFEVGGLIPHSSYYFKVRAKNGDGASAFGVATPPADNGAFVTVTACAQTFGPKRPIFHEPATNGDLKGTRCDFTIVASADPADPFRVQGMLVNVNATVPGTGVGHTDTLYVGPVPDSTEAPNHYQYAEGPGPGQYVVTEVDEDGAGPNPARWEWTIKYQFRRGVNYRLIATSYLASTNHYASATVEVRDVRVVADCPLEQDPLP